MPGSSGTSFAKKSHLKSGTETCPSGRKSACGSASADTRRKGVGTPDVSQSSASSSSSSAVFSAFPFFISMEKYYF